MVMNSLFEQVNSSQSQINSVENFKFSPPFLISKFGLNEIQQSGKC